MIRHKGSKYDHGRGLGLRRRALACCCALMAPLATASAQTTASAQATASLQSTVSSQNPAAGIKARYPLTTEQVISAMQLQQMPVAGVEIKLAAAITASVPNPGLEIQSASALGERQVRLRMACRIHVECLPFFVTATWPDADAPAKVLSSYANPHGAKKSAVAALENVGKTAASESGAQAAVKAGAPVTLLIEGDRIHIRLQAVCLQAGVTGDKVRVTTRDHRQAYVAEIVSTNLLRGSL